MDLGDRMKNYESIETFKKLVPGLPIVVRLDGKAFHSFTKDLDKPYDLNLNSIFIDTLMYLVKETRAVIGYHQSDEMSLILNYKDNNEFFDGKTFKLNSILASMATAMFNKNIYKLKNKEMALFDCRCFNVPSKEEAINYLIWRELDATKNAITMAASCYFSDRELYGKNSNERQEMLFQQKGINFNDYPDFFKKGTYIKKFTRSVKNFTPEEIEKLPLKHNARINPDLEIQASFFEKLDILPLLRIENKMEVIFGNQ